VSQAASQAATFYAQSVENDAVWTVRDEGGYPAPKNREGRRAQPFWSSRSRVDRIIKNVPAYTGFEPEEIPLSGFVNERLSELESHGFAGRAELERPKGDRLRRGATDGQGGSRGSRTDRQTLVVGIVRPVVGR
jgi:hypothetical protein